MCVCTYVCIGPCLGSTWLSVCVFVCVWMYRCGCKCRSTYNHCLWSVTSGNKCVSVCVCVYAYMHACRYAWIHEWMQVCMNTWHECMYAWVYVCMCACVHVCRNTCIHECMYACIHECTCACMIPVAPPAYVPSWQHSCCILRTLPKGRCPCRVRPRRSAFQRDRIGMSTPVCVVCVGNVFYETESWGAYQLSVTRHKSFDTVSVVSPGKIFGDVPHFFCSARHIGGMGFLSSNVVSIVFATKNCGIHSPLQRGLATTWWEPSLTRSSLGPQQSADWSWASWPPRGPPSGCEASFLREPWLSSLQRIWDSPKSYFPEQKSPLSFWSIAQHTGGDVLKRSSEAHSLRFATTSLNIGPLFCLPLSLSGLSSMKEPTEDEATRTPLLDLAQARYLRILIVIIPSFSLLIDKSSTHPG